MGKRDQSYTTTLGNAIGDAINDLEQFASDIQESADRMSETFPGAERTERYEEAASALSDFSPDPETPGALVDVKVTYVEDTRKNLTNAQRLSNLINVWAAIADAAEDEASGTEDEELQSYVSGLREIADELQGVDL